VIERDDWARLDELLDAALEQPPESRDRFLDEACAGEPEKRARLGELLKHAEDGDERLQPGGGLRGRAWQEIGEEMETRTLGLIGPGAVLGRFVVRDLIGTGGMGQVYRALDPVLGREVAIKAVSQGLYDDAASLRRFEREARLLATLNHPNVGAIYGLEQIDGASFLVLELVEGDTLAQRLERGPFPLGEALAVAVQVADALQEAHRKGIVHRDLKPANVKLTDSGRVKVLDLGIAKPVARTTEEGVTPSAPHDPTTMPGTLLGTAPYMSPEQVRGLPVDPRSDLWSFGCVLYEMLTGRRAFPGHSAPDVVAAVLRDEVDWSALPPDTPQGVRRLLRRCLRKDPRDRLQDAGDARIELTEAAMEEPAPAPERRSWRRLLGIAGTASAALLIGAGIAAYWRHPSPERPRPVRLSLQLPKGLSLADDFAAPFALSPDGSRLALLAKVDGPLRIYERALGGLDVAPVPGTEGAWQPAFSPDGRRIAFFADRKLKTVTLGGGGVQTVADIGGSPRGVSWAEDGTIVVSPSQTSGLVRVDPQGDGAQRPLTRLDEAAGEVSHRWPQVLPGGRDVLFTVASEDGTYDEARLETVSLATGRRRRLLEAAAHGRYIAGGRLLFVRGGRLLVVAMDPERLEARGAPEVVAEGVRYDPQNGGAHMAVSAAGTFVYSPAAPTSAEHPLAWIDTAGRLSRIGDTPRAFREPRLSPDGRRVAVVIGKAGESDLWLIDLASSTLSQLTFGLSPRRPAWTPDGRAITVGARKDGSWRLLRFDLREPGTPVTLLDTPHRAYPNAWSPDGRWLVYQELRPGTGWDLFAAEFSPASALVGTRPLATTPFHEESATVSPDGRFVAYESDVLDGVFQVYVRPLHGEGAQVRASSTGARWPRFGAAGGLYYWYSFKGGLQRIDYHGAGDRFVVDSVGPVWSEAGRPDDPARQVVVSATYGGYDVDPSSRRFLMLERGPASGEPGPEAPVVVLNWREESPARDAPRP
jgi:serine/threonine-protein kinase